ncbi:hypothetical protein FN846DRAFT_906697 [Sphaerosporella brunnea]|uniref:Uncharacterized protein n=1 Tax=Sphaerosporella brunnea TaxID=1250544 RepID=A0A5J5EXN5_9PEZI|nr:hypothetical protein FN846DRAFT_906697 [Sphaerosporella brunnea]
MAKARPLPPRRGCSKHSAAGVDELSTQPANPLTTKDPEKTGHPAPPNTGSLLHGRIEFLTGAIIPSSSTIPPMELVCSDSKGFGNIYSQVLVWIVTTTAIPPSEKQRQFRHTENTEAGRRGG